MSIKKYNYTPVRIQRSLEKFHDTMNTRGISFEQQQKIIENIKQRMKYNLNPHLGYSITKERSLEDKNKRKEFIKGRDDKEITNSLRNVFESDPLSLSHQVEGLQIDITNLNKKKENIRQGNEKDLMKLLNNKDHEKIFRKEQAQLTLLENTYKYIYTTASLSSQEEIIGKLNQHYNAFTQRQRKTSQDILDSEYDVSIHLSHFMYHLDEGNEESRKLMFQLYTPEDNILGRHYKLLLFVIELCHMHDILSKEIVDIIYNIGIIIHQRFDIDPKFRLNLNEGNINENHKQFFATMTNIIENIIVKSVKNKVLA